MIMTKTAVTELLREHGIKPTPNRILVAFTLANAGCPMSISELESGIMTIDKSNIFRVIELFKKCDLLHVISDERDIKYEICLSHDHEEDDDSHVHFHCKCCNAITCLHDVGIPKVELPGEYEAEEINFVIKGRCPACKSKNAT